nr:aminotransferase class I/II-fold pyridoxal phosphate-dependent enzyme [Candidatus Sigynarchaeota archaeon]
YYNEHPGMLDSIIKAYTRRRDLCCTRLNAMGLHCPKPGGAFYVMPDVHEATGMDGAAFSMKLVEEKSVATVAGSTFGSYSGNRIRISYALDDQKLGEALDRVEDVVKISG